jgi:hypothetical protein
VQEHNANYDCLRDVPWRTFVRVIANDRALEMKLRATMWPIHHWCILVSTPFPAILFQPAV